MNFEKLDSHMKKMQEEGIPLTSVSVYYKGDVVYKNIFGYREDGKTPIKSNEPFFLYSCSKVITASAAMRLVEEGKLDLDAPVAKYIPEYETVYIGKDKVPAKNTMTVRHLLTMTSGYGYDFDAENITKASQNKSASTMDIIKALAKDSIYFEPGTRFCYGFGLDIIGAIIEVVSGMKFSEYLSKNIFIPLGMNDTTFKLTADDKEKMWPQYRYDEKNKKFRNEPKENIFIFTDEFESGGAGLISTSDDYIKFVAALANYGVSSDGYHLLSKESIDEMRKNYLTNDELLKDYFKKDQGYGYGLGVRTLINNNDSRSPIGEFGWDSAACAFNLVDVDNDLAIFIGCHVLGWGEGYANHYVIRDLVYDCLGL